MSLSKNKLDEALKTCKEAWKVYQKTTEAREKAQRNCERAWVVYTEARTAKIEALGEHTRKPPVVMVEI